MLNPCTPCVCPKAPCEQCRYGYRTDKERHAIMKEVIIATNRGEKPLGWGTAERYKLFHPNWQAEMEEECDG